MEKIKLFNNLQNHTNQLTRGCMQNGTTGLEKQYRYLQVFSYILTLKQRGLLSASLLLLLQCLLEMNVCFRMLKPY